MKRKEIKMERIRGCLMNLKLYKYHKCSNYSSICKKGNRLTSNYCRNIKEYSRSNSLKLKYQHNIKSSNRWNNIINKRTIS